MAQKRPDNHREKRLREVCSALGYEFKDLTLLNRALTHSSLGNDGLPNYERLEFLGDAVLGFLVAESLYKQKPEIPEGELTSRRSLMVSRRPLAEVAIALRLVDYLQVGRGLTEDALGSERILADLVEAVLGAIVLDGGVTPARRFVKTFVLDRFGPLQQATRTATDPKTRLNQWAQSHAVGPPTYEIVESHGPDHDPTFRVAVRLGSVVACSSEVKSKQAGEQEAAAKAHALLTRPLVPPPGEGAREGATDVIWDEEGDHRKTGSSRF